jgi:hypothetical protein
VRLRLAGLGRPGPSGRLIRRGDGRVQHTRAGQLLAPSRRKGDPARNGSPFSTLTDALRSRRRRACPRQGAGR